MERRGGKQKLELPLEEIDGFLHFIGHGLYQTTGGFNDQVQKAQHELIFIWLQFH